MSLENPEDQIHNAPDQDSIPNDPDAIVAEINKWRDLAEEERLKAEENHNLYLRALADLDNLRRRARKEMEQSLKYGVVPLMESLLPVLDNFERALEAADQSENATTLKDGIEMVYRQFLQVLSDSGLTFIEAEGKAFDPHFHHAVQQIQTDQIESGMVVEELQSGYSYHDRVIRPSMVKVSE